MEALLSQATKRRKAARDAVKGAPIFRAFGVQTRTLNKESRTIEAAISTETPVLEFDYERWQFIPRVLLSSGAQFPPSGQIPFLDSHNRAVMGNQLGSARGIKTEGSQVVGTLHFASTADDAWRMVEEGHATDVSAGFQVQSEIFVDSGKTQRIQGKDYTGPINVATKWRLYEVSLTPIGADEQAKLRGFDPNGIPQRDEQEFEMLKELRDLLLSRGMPSELDDAQAQEWMVKNPDKLADRKAPTTPPPIVVDPVQSHEETIRKLDELAQAREAKRIEERKQFRADVTELCDLAEVRDLAEKCYDMPDLVAVRAKVKEVKAERAKTGTPGLGFTGVRITGDGRSAFRKDLLTHFVDRAVQQNGTKEETAEKVFPKALRGTNDGRWKHAKLVDLARECLIADGYDPQELRYLAATDIATAVMSRPSNVGLSRFDQRDADDSAYHMTGSFAYLTENTLKKTLEAGYQDAPSSWELIMSQGQSFTDFKPKKIYTLSEAGNLTAWLDGQEPDPTTMMDTKDSYGVDVVARSLSFSWQLLLNDDLSALTRAPAKLGAAARRTLNAYAWSLLTSNPTMRDGQALLLASATGNRKKANYVTSSGGAPDVTRVGVLTNLMRQQVGENTREGGTSPQILNLQPKYLVAPSALEVTVNQLVNSAYDPAASTGHGVYNPTRVLTPIIEPLLDANSTTKWYLFADKSQIDTIEISYLAGHESPVVWSDMDTKTLTKWFAVRQGYGGKALHWQGVAANDGDA